MADKRRDNKKRILRVGEQQRADGRYMYMYKDNSDKWCYIYSWRLEPTDKMPAGKRQDLSLREKEKLIQKELAENEAYHSGDTTVLQLVEKYIKQKRGVRPTTMNGYKTVINVLSKEECEFGSKKISTVKLSDAKEWLIQLQDKGKGYSSIHSIRGVLRPAFQLAVDDDLIRKNPFQFQLATVVVNDSVTREAITRKQERQFLEFVKNDDYFSKYYETVFILFKTGMRISEFCGLTLKDVDTKKKTVNIDHQLQTTAHAGTYIEKTKTTAGTRVIPISDEVCECFKTIIRNRKNPKVEPMIDGYTGFLFLDKNNKPLVAYHWEKYFQRMCEKYNNTYKVQMPKITPHVCRHTYCSNMAKSGMNPKTLQYLMGHSDIGVTLNTYTHMSFEDAEEEVRRVCNG